MSQGKYAEAEPFYRRALKIMEEALAKNHPHVATVCENLAELYRKVGSTCEKNPVQSMRVTVLWFVSESMFQDEIEHRETGENY